MSERREPAVEMAPERYELDEAPRYRADLGRRGFLGVLTAMGGGLLVVASAADAQQESGRGRQGDAASNDLASWIHIDTKGQVTGFTGKVEIGQNIRTSLAQTIADELHVDLDAVSMVMADTALTPFDMGTFGSRTTPTMAPVLARAAASAREQLVARAASKWQVAPAALKVERGVVQGSDGRHVSYGELIAAGDLSGVVSADVQAAPTARWEIRGTAARKVNGREIVAGGHAFTPDLTRPGMLHGRIVRPPAYGAKRVAVDERGARAIDGVKVVVEDDLVAVLAPNERKLQRAVAAMRVTWSDAPVQPDSKSIYEHLKRTAQPGGGGGRGGSVRGDVDAAVRGAPTVLRESYLIPYIAHVPLEPRAAVAEWRADGGVTIWTGTQRPFGVRTEVADAFRLAEDRVRVIVPDMGSAYGGKHTGEQAIEAARLAKAAGRPVKIVYTRQEEFMWGYFRPAGVIEVAAALDRSGRLVSWEFHNYNSGASGIQTPYSVPNQRVVFHDADSPLRQGSYRGLAATANHYAREMHMDALARRASVDRVTFRRNHLTEPRLRAVLDAVASKAGWPAAAAGKALGIACGTEKGSYVATVAEVARSAGGFEVVRLIVAFECGAIVNPDGLRNQVEGSIVQGLGGALFEAVAFAGGRLQNGSMAQYRVPRFKDIPPIEIILLDRPDLPSAGAGETPIVCVAPAIGSAVRTFGEVDPALPVRLKA